MKQNCFNKSDRFPEIISLLTPAMTCRAETAEAQMMKTGDFNAAPAKEDWGGEDGVQDWSADGQTAAAAPAAAAPAQPPATR